MIFISSTIYMIFVLLVYILQPKYWPNLQSTKRYVPPLKTCQDQSRTIRTHPYPSESVWTNQNPSGPNWTHQDQSGYVRNHQDCLKTTFPGGEQRQLIWRSSGSLSGGAAAAYLANSENKANSVQLS